VDYRQLFVAHTTRSANVILKQLQEIEGVPSLEVRSQALLTLSYALRMPEVWTHARSLLLQLAPLMEQVGLWDEWRPFLEEGIVQAQALNDLVTLAELQICLGNLRRRQSKFDAAAALLERAAASFEMLELPQRRAVSLSRLANVALAQRNYARGQTLLDEALSLLPAGDPERAYCYFVQGQLAIEQMQWASALDALHETKTIAEAANDARLRGLALLNLGRVYEQQRAFDASIAHYEQAMAIFERNQDPINLAVTQMNLGLVYMVAEAPEQALRYYRQAEATLRKVGDRRYLAMVYNNLGMLYRDLGRWADAEETLQAGIAIWRALGDTLARLNVEGNLAIAYMRQAKYSRAVDALQALFGALETVDPAVAERGKLRDHLLPYLQEAQAKAGKERGSVTEALSGSS
jgi:tetratricopeptide (TPR) repeat protein